MSNNTRESVSYRVQDYAGVRTLEQILIFIVLLFTAGFLCFMFYVLFTLFIIPIKY